MKPPTGWQRLLYLDQTRAKLDMLDLIDTLPDGRLPGAEELRRVVILCMQRTRGLVVSGDGGREALEAQLRTRLAAGDKRATPRILNTMIPDHRIRIGVAIAYLLFKPVLFIAVCVAMFRYGLAVLGYVLAALLALSVLLKLMMLGLGALAMRRSPHNLDAMRYQQLVDSCLERGDLAGAEQAHEKLRALRLLHPESALIAGATERAALKIMSYRAGKR